jgi:hypothetical protein
MGHNIKFVTCLLGQGELDGNSSFVIGIHWSPRFSSILQIFGTVVLMFRIRKS